MGSKRVWQLKHTAPVHVRARTRMHTHGMHHPQGAGVRRAAGKTAGENASGVKKSYARGADERALFTVKMADYARRHANVRAFTRVCQAE